MFSPIAVEKDDEGNSHLARPAGFGLHQTWAELEKLVDEGLIKSIGVSNYNVQLLNDLLNYARVKPAVNQVFIFIFLFEFSNFSKKTKHTHLYNN